MSVVSASSVPDLSDHSNCSLQGPLYDNAFRFEAAFRRGYFLAFLGMRCHYTVWFDESDNTARADSCPVQGSARQRN